MKFHGFWGQLKSFPGRPHAGAWIEIIRCAWLRWMCSGRPHAGAWIEIFSMSSKSSGQPGRPHAGAWIEIPLTSAAEKPCLVAPTRGRGLKYNDPDKTPQGKPSPPRGGVD